MATDKINNYSIGDNNFESVMLTLDQTFRNKHDCYSFSATALKAGSVIEINGSLYPVTQDVALPNMTSKKYLMAVPSSAGTFTLLATSTAPTWSDTKQGFYGTSTTANYKYIAVKEGTTIYKYNDRPFYVSAIYADALNMSGNITTAGDITCDDITCDDIACDNIDAHTVVTDVITCGSQSFYSIEGNRTIEVIRPTTIYCPHLGSVQIYINGFYKPLLSDDSAIAANPGTYKLGSGTYGVSGAFGTISISEVLS